MGVVIFGVGLGVLTSQQHNAEISSVPFRVAPIILLVAGILCILVGGFLIFVTKRTAITKSKTRRYSLIVSNFSFYCYHYYLKNEILGSVLVRCLALPFFCLPCHQSFHFSEHPVIFPLYPLVCLSSLSCQLHFCSHDHASQRADYISCLYYWNTCP